MNRARSALIAAYLCIFASGAPAEEPRTLRIGVPGLLASAVYYHESSPATQLITHAVFDTLIAYDERRARYVPLLAKTWRRIDDRTLEFELRDDLNWHDRVALDADDVVYTLNWLGDDHTHLHMRHKWEWIDHAEKLGRHKLRLMAKRPTPFDEARLASTVAILPEHRHGMLLAERSYFGKTPIGSGPYRARVADRAGIVLERNEAYRHGGEVKVPTNVARIALQGSIAPEHLLPAFAVGTYDLVLDAPPEAAAETPGTPVIRLAGYGILTLVFDIRGTTSGLADPRVRRALDSAIDRSVLVARTPGARRPDRLCWTEQTGCGAAPPPARYDPAGARDLLASAGHAGLALTLAAYGASAEAAAEVIAEQWRVIGVDARVAPVSAEQLYMRHRDGLLQAAVIGWHAGEMPDVAETVATFLAPGFWDMHGDPALHALARASDVAMHDAARREIVRQAWARAGDLTYFTVLAPLPAFAALKPEVAIDPRGRFGALGLTLLDVRWR